MISLYAILGLEPASPESAVEAAFKRLTTKLDPNNFKEGSAARAQAERCIGAIEHAYGTLTVPELKNRYERQHEEQTQEANLKESRPRLGQLCVASGMITMEQLKEAVDMQHELQLPLGEVLQHKQFISQAELDGLLLGQEMIDVPSGVTDALGLRLVSTGLVSEDMVLIAQMEKRTQGRTMEDLLVRHGWVDAEVMNALLS